MITQLTHFADSSSGLGSLGIDGKAFIIQLVTFVLAFLVLRRWAFGPIIKVLRERQNTIEAGVKLGEEMQKEKAELDAKVEKALHEARQQADGIIAEAQDAAREAARATEEKSKAKAESIVAAAEDRIQQDTARARKALEKELVGLISDATEAIIEEKIDARKDSQLIERALKERRAA